MSKIVLTISQQKQRIYVACVMFMLPVFVFANTHGGGTYGSCAAGKLCNPLKGNMGLWELIEFLVRDILVEIIAPIAITLALIWSGFMFIKAQGNTSELETARRNFLYVIAGAVLLLGAYLILEVVLNTVGEITR